jgi:3-deoxy-D-manno-octulosonic-acid transferase
MENFATLAKALVSKKGAIQVSDMGSLELTIAELLRDSEARKRLVQRAREVLSEHQGATARRYSNLTAPLRTTASNSAIC